MKQIPFMKKTYGALLAGLLMLAMVVGTLAGGTVQARADGGAPSSGAYEPGRKGSIRIELQDIEGAGGTNKDGVELTLYKMGKIDVSRNYIDFDLVDALAGEESLAGLDLGSITTAADNLAAARLLEEVAAGAGLESWTETTRTVTGADGASMEGVALFDNGGEGLDQGMYLLVQTNANAYGVTSAMLIAIPYMTDGTSWIYDVTAGPKGAAFESLGSIQVTKALKYDHDGVLLDQMATDASYDIGLFMDAAGQYRYGGDNWRQTVRIQDAVSGTITFEDLPVTDKPYYIFELDEDGQSIGYGVAAEPGSENLFTVMAGEDPAAEAAGTAPSLILDPETGTSQAATISNVYSDLPDGHYVIGEITIAKSVMDEGKMITSNDVFYAGIFAVDAQGNRAATPTEVVKLANNSTVTVEVPLGGTNGTEPITYAVLETDENGIPVDKETFPYTVTGEGNVSLSMDQQEATVNLVNTLGGGEGYYQEEPSTEAPSTTDPGSGNDKNTGGDRSSSGTSRSTTSKKTGDDNQILLYAGLLAAAVIIGGTVVVRRRRRNG